MEAYCQVHIDELSCPSHDEFEAFTLLDTEWLGQVIHSLLYIAGNEALTK